MYLLFNHCYDPGNEPPNYVLLGPFAERDDSLVSDVVAVGNIPRNAVIGWFEASEDVLMDADHCERYSIFDWLLRRLDYLESELDDYKKRRMPAQLMGGHWSSPVSQARVDLEIAEREARVIACRRRLFKLY